MASIEKKPSNYSLAYRKEFEFIKWSRKMKELIEEHIKVFEVEPYIIGMYWSNQEYLCDLIWEFIDKGVPYDERKQLTKDELKAYNDGLLKF